jgi:hypothetical protein
VDRRRIWDCSHAPTLPVVAPPRTELPTTTVSG